MKELERLSDEELIELGLRFDVEGDTPNARTRVTRELARRYKDASGALASHEGGWRELVAGSNYSSSCDEFYGFGNVTPIKTPLAHKHMTAAQKKKQKERSND